MKKPFNPAQFLQRIRTQLKGKDGKGGIKPFSWQTVLLLSLFAWCICLLVRNYELKRFVEFFGWLFLIIGVDWMLLEREGKAKREGEEFTIPVLDVQVRYSPWVTGALVTLALLSYRFIITNGHSALIAYPLISAAIAALPLLLKPGPQFKQFTELEPAERQSLITLALIASLLSCWFEFGFQVQDLVRQYPSLQADDFSKSAFVVQLNRAGAPRPDGVAMLDNAEQIIRNQLATQSPYTTQQWLQSLTTQVPQLDTQIKTQVFGNVSATNESRFWQFNAQYQNAMPNKLLQLQATWHGPSSVPGGYTLYKTCTIGPPPIQANTPLTGVLPLNQLTCGKIQAIDGNGQAVTTLKNIQSPVRQVRPVRRNPVQDFWRSIQRWFGKG